jgi:methionyl-tRNA formyltransferase
MGTFGQKVPSSIFDSMPLGFYNFHPCVNRHWPSYVGGNPFRAMIENNEQECVLAMHEVDEQWDNGALVTFSRSFSIGSNDDVISLHKKTAIAAPELMEMHLNTFLNIPDIGRLPISTPLTAKTEKVA